MKEQPNPLLSTKCDRKYPMKQEMSITGQLNDALLILRALNMADCIFLSGVGKVARILSGMFGIFENLAAPVQVSRTVYSLIRTLGSSYTITLLHSVLLIHMAQRKILAVRMNIRRYFQSPDTMLTYCRAGIPRIAV